MSQTVMNSNYLERQLTKANAYDRLSSALSNDISQQAGATANPQITPVVQGILTPIVLKQKINNALDQMSLYYQGKGNAPTLDLNGLAQQVQAAGVPLPGNSDLSQPIQLVPDSGTGHTVAYPGHSLSQSRAITIFTSVLLTVALAIISWRRRRYGALPRVLVAVSVLIGLLAISLAMVPGLADHFITFSGASDTFLSLGRDIAENILRDLARRFGFIAVGCLAVGLGLGFLATRLNGKKVLSSRVVNRLPGTLRN